MTKAKDPCNRRKFIRTTSSSLLAAPFVPTYFNLFSGLNHDSNMILNDVQTEKSIIGQYGPWATSLLEDPPQLSFRKEEHQDVEAWRQQAKSKALEYLSLPEFNRSVKVVLENKYYFDGLTIEELSWQLPFGRATKATLLQPANQSGPFPGVIALHDHGGNKYFGRRKIIKTGGQHPMMVEHQKQYYGGRAWANELAKMGYAVLVSDTFTFGSRRVHFQDVDGINWGPLNTSEKVDENMESVGYISAYNEWAGLHEHVMSKSLFCAGTTWPAVFLSEDQIALDILAARKEVDANRLGCCGLSGGGLRSVYLGGFDERIKCAVPVGFMTTWRDLILNKSYTHTWMTYIPLLPKYLDFPDILSLRLPKATMVLNNRQDQLFTLPEMIRTDNILKEIYSKAEASENYQGRFYNGPHKFDLTMQEDAFSFLEKHIG